ncbi:MAG: SIS domain-containing protein [Burkholderiaceae bacterium]
MLEQRIQQQFFDAADLKNQTAEALARPLAQAAQSIVGALTGGGKLLVAGIGAASALAALFAARTMGRFERDRPGLAVLALDSDATVHHALAADGGGDSALARQVSTLGQPGDLLLLLDAEGRTGAALAAARAAHGNDMAVIALVGRQAGALGEELGDTDALLPVPHDRAARVLELHLIMLHCLCDAIDLQLLGEQEAA